MYIWQYHDSDDNNYHARNATIGVRVILHTVAISNAKLEYMQASMSNCGVGTLKLVTVWQLELRSVHIYMYVYIY